MRVKRIGWAGTRTRWSSSGARWMSAAEVGAIFARRTATSTSWPAA